MVEIFDIVVGILYNLSKNIKMRRDCNMDTREIQITNKTDIVHYPNPDKVGLIVTGESSTFYKKHTDVDYYEGE
jgi:hypothetical protein